ncbi:DUF1456 family protein [Photobacterium piscicola]|uniref:DUF1456 family protein n=1 Tax=Photobacterium piscicola TaxID=1378299 RepID=UPI002E171810|nr:DUF1456 family protein [Photobacterium piscicola]
MTNNDVLRRVRYTFDLNDSEMIAIFAAADCEVTREQVCNWLKADDAEGYKSCSDEQVATFLNGFINQKRGKKEGEQPAPEQKITNNIIFRKLQIALNLKADDVLDLFKLVDFRLSKHELSAFFRKVDHKHYRDCKDQVLRNFLQALQINHRGVEPSEEIIDDK